MEEKQETEIKPTKKKVTRGTRQTSGIIPRELLQPIATLTGMDVAKTRALLKDSVFKASKKETAWTENEVAAALVFCKQYQLNPLTKEIQFFRAGGKVTPYVGHDGWVSIARRQPDYNGCTFEYITKEDDQSTVIAVTAIIYRKEIDHPFSVTEWYQENYKQTMPWNTMPNRMLRQKAFNQCARLAFGINAESADDFPDNEAPLPVNTETIIDLSEVVDVTDAEIVLKENEI